MNVSFNSHTVCVLEKETVFTMSEQGIQFVTIERDYPMRPKIPSGCREFQ